VSFLLVGLVQPQLLAQAAADLIADAAV
jgi:hypothetical protein